MRIGVAALVGIAAAGGVAWKHHVPPSFLLVAIAAVIGGVVAGTLLWRTPRQALVGLLVAAGGVGWIGWAPGAPGVTVVVIDCLSAHRLNEDLMPRTWAVTRRAYRWDHALAQSSWTRSSVGSLLTGTWPNRHQLYRLKPAPDRVAPGVPLLAERVAASGRATAMFAEQAQLDPAFGLATGFDRYGHKDGRARDVLGRYGRWRTFFRHVPHLAWIHVLDIHKPYTPKGRRDDAPRPMHPTGNPRDDQDVLMDELNHGGRKLARSEWATLRNLHEAEITELDTELGKLWAALRADGTFDTDWVIITADHGEAFGEHGWFTHGGTPWNELIEIPLVIRPPGGVKGTEMSVTARHIDLAPTILGFFGLSAEGMDGRDLGPALRGETLPDVPSFAEYNQEGGRRIAVRLGSRSLVSTPDGEQGFDLTTDPGQQAPIAPDPDLVALLQQYVAADGKSGGSVETSAETMEQLRQLGYLGPD